MTAVIGKFPVSATMLERVGCPRATVLKAQKAPREILADADNMQIGIDMHAIIDWINQHRFEDLSEGQIDEALRDLGTGHFEELRRMALNYYNSRYFPIRDIVQSEISLALDENYNPIDYDDPRAMIRGRIDCIIKTARDGYVIVDHKTSYAPYSADTFQNRFYAWLMHKCYEDHPDWQSIQTALSFPRLKILRYAERRVNEWGNLERSIRAMIEKAWNTPIDGPPFPGKWCQYCDWCMTCPAVNVEGQLGLITSYEEAQKYAEELTVLDRRFSEVQTRLKAWVTDNGKIKPNETSPVSIGDGEKVWGFKLSRQYSVNKDEVLAKMVEYPDLSDHISIIKTKQLVGHPACLDIKDRSVPKFCYYNPNKEEEDDQ